MARLLMSAALIAISAGPLVARQASTGASTGAPGAVPGAELFLPGMPRALYASDLIGMEVYSSATNYSAEYGDSRPATSVALSQWDDIGKITDVVLSPEGEVRGVLVDIGGFLGIGAHSVALDMHQVHFLRDETGNEFAAVTSSRGALEAAPQYERVDPTAAVAAAATGAASNALTAQTVTKPQEFADAAGSANMLEIQTSQLALEWATRPEVRAFAQHMIEDHTAAGRKMEAAANTDGVAPPVAMAEAEQAAFDQLQSTPQTEFDLHYVSLQTAAHDQAVALFSAFSSSGEKSALRDFAAETLPTLQQHQAAARELAKHM